MKEILLKYGIYDFDSLAFGDGLINSTYKIESPKGVFLLQKINVDIFNQPKIIAQNLNLANVYLKEKHPEYLFLETVKTVSGEDLVFHDGEVWRLFPFIENTKSINVIKSSDQAYLAASAFGSFFGNFDGIDLSDFESSIPNFHNLSFRYTQFLEAFENGNPVRIEQQRELILEFLNRKSIVDQFESLVNNPDFPDRLIHHDTKINNVLFDKELKSVVCICDLDTLMPGKVISDLGDMVRTYTCSESEESQNIATIHIVDDFFEAVMKGFLAKSKWILTKTEKENLIFAGQFMIYMQGLRFLTDYLNDDTYYQINYPEQNLMRAKNQMALLQDLESKQEKFKAFISHLL